MQAKAANLSGSAKGILQSSEDQYFLTISDDSVPVSENPR